MKKSKNLIVDDSICKVYDVPIFGGGACCCNCKHQVELRKHPWNKKFGKGSCNEICGYACIISPDDSWRQKGTFSDDQHGLCEFHERRLIPEEIKNLIVL